jgi:subtilisin family serine protease
VLLRHAPNARLRVERALESDGVTDELRLLHALARLYRRVVATGEQLDVLNLSLGGYTFDDRPSPLIAEALARIGRSTVIVAAAGNHNSDRPFWPAALKNVIGVAALKSDHVPIERAPFSDYGWWVDACAIGVDVSSSFVTFADEDGPDFQGYATWSGTSFAAPKVAGAITHLAATKDISAADAAELLLDPDTNQRIPDLGTVVTG